VFFFKDTCRIFLGGILQAIKEGIENGCLVI